MVGYCSLFSFFADNSNSLTNLYSQCVEMRACIHREREREREREIERRGSTEQERNGKSVFGNKHQDQSRCQSGAVYTDTFGTAIFYAKVTVLEADRAETRCFCIRVRSGTWVGEVLGVSPLLFIYCRSGKQPRLSASDLPRTLGADEGFVGVIRARWPLRADRRVRS